jgi:hypothetical protein
MILKIAFLLASACSEQPYTSHTDYGSYIPATHDGPVTGIYVSCTSNCSLQHDHRTAIMAAGNTNATDAHNYVYEMNVTTDSEKFCPEKNCQAEAQIGADVLFYGNPFGFDAKPYQGNLSVEISRNGKVVSAEVISFGKHTHADTGSISFKRTRIEELLNQSVNNFTLVTKFSSSDPRLVLQNLRQNFYINKVKITISPALSANPKLVWMILGFLGLIQQ